MRWFPGSLNSEYSGSGRDHDISACRRSRLDPQSETACHGLSLVRLNASYGAPWHVSCRAAPRKKTRTRWRGSRERRRAHVHLGAFTGWQSALESRPVNATRGSQTCVFAVLASRSHLEGFVSSGRTVKFRAKGDITERESHIRVREVERRSADIFNQ